MKHLPDQLPTSMTLTRIERIHQEEKIDNARHHAAQFEKVSTPYSEYPTKIKIIKPDGETNWMDITEDELEQIRKLLSVVCAFCGEKMYTTVKAHSHTENGEDVTMTPI